jgi:uncharacterized protein YfaA (DUF2138 family)
MEKKVWIGGVAAVVAVAAALWWGSGWARFGGAVNALGVDLGQPQAYISSSSLSALPRDLAKAPVLRELLNEDFVFYYEDHEDRLNLQGTLKRLAFEHQPSLSDKLINLALDEPAELAFWTDAKSAPRHWALAMTRGSLAKALQGLAALAAKDKQLTLIGELRSSRLSLQKQPVYALTLSSRRTLAIATRGNRVVVLSDPGLLFDAQREGDAKAAQVLAELLSGDSAEQSPWRRHFNVAPPTAGHTLVAGSALMAFGWQHFFPSIEALRVDVPLGGATLRTALRRSAAASATAATSGPSPWAVMPSQAAACAGLPVDWARARAVLGDIGKTNADVGKGLAAVAQGVGGAAAVCVYARSQLHTPLLVAHASGPAPDAAALQAFMAWWLPKSAAFESATGMAVQAKVPARWGPLKAGDSSAYQPTLRREGDWWLFSPDAALVALAADTVARRFPSVADSWGGATNDGLTTLAVAAPAQMADLAKRETLAVLTPQQTNFKQAAEQQLWPRLAAFAQLNAVRAVAVGAPDAQGWTNLEWQPTKAAAK